MLDLKLRFNNIQCSYLANEITPETCMQKHKIIIKYSYDISIGS